MFDKTAVCYLKQQIYGKLKMNINKNPINFCVIFTFPKWMLWNFYGSRAEVFFLKGLYPLRLFRNRALWASVPSQRISLYPKEAFAILCGRGKHAARLLRVHPWSCACRLVVRTGLLGVCALLALYVWMPCMHNCCMHAWSCVCMLEAKESQGSALVPCGVGEEHRAEVHTPRRCLCITDAEYSTVQLGPVWRLFA